MKQVFYLLITVTFVFVLHRTGTGQTISDVSQHRIEGAFAVIEYTLNSDIMDECGVIWSDTGAPDFTNKIGNASPSSGTYQDSITGLSTSTT